MSSDLEKLLYQRLVLHTKKFELLHALNLKSYVKSVHTLNRIHLILNREILVNRKICKHIQKQGYPKDIRKRFVEPVCRTLIAINTVLRKENTVLCQANVFTYSYSVAQKMLTGKQGYFHKRVRAFRRLAEKELALHSTFFQLSRKLPASYQINEDAVRGSWKLVADLQNELRTLAHAVGDTALVKKHGEHALILIGKIQKTEIYEFVQQDVTAIKARVKYVMAHPKENKLAYFLATVYIIAPGTFEMTGVILFFRYFGKYTLSKTRKLRTRFTKASAR